jgi:molybdate transport system substrate-binding protein
MTTTIVGISSMATRQLLAELSDRYRSQSGTAVAFESVGGVDAVKRVQAGEPFDVVVLAADAIDKLLDTGRVAAGSRIDLARSGVGIAVCPGFPQPDIDTEDALKEAVLSARTVGYSTGPSGVALARLFDRWGIADAINKRMVQAPPGVPVGELVANGDVELGFQQLSELMHLPGINVLGMMPPGCEILTTFSAGLCAASPRADAVRKLLAFMQSSDVSEIKRRQGMEPL